jgi:ABC-2 type transport system permease protein
MNIRRIGVLLHKELTQGAKSFIVIFAVIIPLAISLLVSLVFGRLFSEMPRVGLLDEGDSQLTALFAEQGHIDTRLYTDEAALRRDTERGVVEVGIIVPVGFDEALVQNTETDISIFFWGESNTMPRATIVFALANHIVTISGRDIPATINAVSLGSGEVVSWSERLLPMLLLMSVILGGTLIPSVSLVDEKTRKTLRALTVTPTTLFDVFVAKAVLGIAVSVMMGIVILSVNRAFGTHPILLIVTLTLGAIVAALFGVILGTAAKSLNGLFTLIKPMALVLYAPAIIEMFPNLPQWLAQVFPTYYIFRPVLEVAQNNAVWRDIIGMLGVLVLMIALLVGGLLLLTGQETRREALEII